MNRIGAKVGCLLMLGAAFAFGAQVTVCTAPGQSTTQPLAGINANTYVCGDKIFSNFTSTGGIDGSVFIREITTDNYELAFTASGSGYSSPFTFGYTVAVDTVHFPAFAITQIQDGILTTVAAGGATSIPNASTVTVTHTPGGTDNLNALSAPGQNGLANVSTQNETVLFAYNPTGNAGQPAGNFLSVDQVISQSTIPEPMTLSLTGIGLLGIGIFGRRRMVKQ